MESILGCSSCLLRQLTGPQNLWLPLSKKTERRGCCFCLVCVPSVGASPPRLSSSSCIPAPRETIICSEIERLLSILPPQAVLFLRRQRPSYQVQGLELYENPAAPVTSSGLSLPAHISTKKGPTARLNSKQLRLCRLRIGMALTVHRLPRMFLTQCHDDSVGIGLQSLWRACLASPPVSSGGT